jgi:hypothetical protein
VILGKPVDRLLETQIDEVWRLMANQITFKLAKLVEESINYLDLDTIEIK